MDSTKAPPQKDFLQGETTKVKIREIAFENILNFRDVGRTVNELSGTKIMKEGLLFRSAKPDAASPSDRDALITTYGIHTIIDLRSKTEHLARIKQIHPSSTIPASVPAISLHFEISPIAYHYIDFNAGALERALVWQLSSRMRAINLISINVLRPLGLTGLAVFSLRHAQPQLLSLFTIISSPSAYPLIIHCTHGKDRTGAMIALILLLLDISEDIIQAEYMMTEAALEVQKEERRKEMGNMGLGEDFVGCDKNYVRGICGEIEKWGGVKGYLEEIGFDKGMQNTVRRTLLVDK
ncbi:MAG: hypothetical protein M1834_006498 [Cirrosporium novae-zelandiae]|nr:MAG: hypothetical protein M1834_006498 [Cirrosporium novae-zelandiae]